MAGFFLACALLQRNLFAEEQLRIFRLRFTPLKMTAALYFWELSVRFRFTALTMTAVFLNQPASVWTSSGVGLSFIYGAPFGVNYLQSGRIYFEAEQCEASRPLAYRDG